MSRPLATGAVALVTRAELRTRWRGLVGLGLLLGLVGGVVLGTVAVAERTATAYGRLVAAAGLDDARVLVPVDRPSVAAAVPTLPGVAHAWTASAWIAQLDGPTVRYVSLGGGPGRPDDLWHPVVVDGRAPDPAAPDEVLVSELLAGELGVRVGDGLTARLLLPEEVARFDVGFGAPDGAVAPLRVVGVGRAPAWNGVIGNVLVTPAFAAAHPAETVGHVGLVRLTDTDPATREAFAAGLAAAADAADAAAPAPSAPAAFVRPEPAFPTSEVDPAVRTAEFVLATGLAMFGTVLGTGGLLVVAQGLVRHHGGHREVQRVERALGLTLGERALARVLAGAVGAGTAGLTGGAVAFAAGLLPALGSLARFEPSPGFRAPWAVALAGGAGLALLFGVLTAAGTVLAARRPRPAPLPPATGPYNLISARIGARPALLAGIGVARHGLRGGDGIRTVATVAGLTLVVTAIVATAAFGASLQRLVDTPARYGGTGDLVLSDAREPDVAALVADPRVAALDHVTSTAVALGGEAVPSTVVAVEHRKGAMPVETVAGSAPRGPGEIALGPRTAQRLGLAVGDTVAAGAGGSLRVSGVVVFGTDAGTPLGEGAMVAPAQLPALAPGAAPLVTANIRAAPGQADALFGELSSRLEVFASSAPAEVADLADLTSLPEVLALVLAAVGGAGLVHALLAAGRRHGRDLAVLAVLGATPRQVRATLAVAAAVTVLPPLLVGVPLGLGLARVLWWEVATGVGVGGDLAVPVPVLLALVPGVLVAALAASAVPAARTARTPPAAVLAGE